MNLSALGDLSAIELLQVQSSQANAAVAFLAQLATTAARTPRRYVEEWQRAWNARRVSMVAALRQIGGGSTRIADAIERQGPLAVDGYWGPNTAFTSAVFVTTSLPPSRLADMPAWFRTNGPLAAQRRDAISAALSAARAAPTSTPHVAPAPAPPAPPPEPAPPPPPPEGQPYDASTRQNSSRTPAPAPVHTSSSGGGGGATAMLAVATIGAVGFMFMAGRKEKAGKGLREAHVVDGRGKRVSSSYGNGVTVGLGGASMKDRQEDLDVLFRRVRTARHMGVPDNEIHATLDRNAAGRTRYSPEEVWLAIQAAKIADKHKGLDGLRGGRSLAGGSYWERGDATPAYEARPGPISKPQAAYEVAMTSKRFEKSTDHFTTVSEGMAFLSSSERSGKFKSGQLIEIRDGKRRTIKSFGKA